MRLTLKFLLVATVGILALRVGYGIRRVRRETAQYEAEMRRVDCTAARLLGRTYTTVEHDSGTDRANEILRAATTGTPAIHARIVQLDGPRADSRPLLAPAALAPLERGRQVQQAHDGQMLTYSPLPPDAQGSRRALEVAQSLQFEEAFVRQTTVNTVEGALVGSIITLVLFLILGYWVVGRPMARLVDKARRVGSGDLSGPLGLRQRDEIGTLAREMDAMCERMAESRDKLASETAARIQAIEQLRHADRLRTVGQLASGLAHELGTPLNVARGRAQLLRSGEASREVVTDYARIIQEQTDRMAELIRNLLDFARRRESKRRIVDLHEIAERACTLLGPMADQRKVVVEVQPSERAVMANVAPEQMQQVVTNVVLNAIQALTPGGKVRVSSGSATVHPPADVGGQEGTFHFVAIEDDGPGIAESDLSRIFEPFFTTKEVGEGTGLGLSVAYAIARDHGGWIEVESKVGRGTRFAVYLPPEREASQSATRGEAA